MSTTPSQPSSLMDPARLAIAVAQADASPDGILVVSPDGRMLFMNDRFVDIWRFPPEVIESGDDAVALQAAVDRVADRDGFVERVQECYSARLPSRDEVLLRDGRVLDRYGSALTAADGEYLGYAWYFRDITERKRDEAELRELARTLQASLLPPRAPQIPGMEVATHYRPADRVAAVGGDFFDVFRLGSNDWGLAIGDVCGKGAQAASLTALTRYTLRAAAVHNFDPAEVLAELNAAILAEPDVNGRYCSVVFARLELDKCGAWVTVSCGGHPRPIVVRRAGWVDVRGMHGMLIGLFDEPELFVDRVGLGPGDALVFCTDGITESRNADGEMFGEDGLPTTLLRHAGDDAATIANAVAEEALAFASGRTHDDVAILVVRVPETAVEDPMGRLSAATGVPVEELELPNYPVGDEVVELRTRRVAPPREARIRLTADARSASDARKFVSSVLHSWRMGELVEGDLELLTSEVASNAVRHAASDFTVIVRYDGRVVRVEVGDGSRALPVPRNPKPEDTGGRGMFLVDQLSSTWGVAPTVDGKRVWFEVPAPVVPE